jgi:SAM-dependent methyltransferase
MSNVTPANYTLKPDRYSSHAQIARWLDDYRRRRTAGECVVLDVGCARGFLGAWLAPPEFYLIGVDIEKSFLENLNPHYQQAILADIEQPLPLPLARAPHVLVLADVLEHVRQPEAVLTRLCQQHLTPGAAVIVSLPNAVHLYVRLSILLGRFNYAERGILDRTHVRFYTLSTALDLCRKCGIATQQVAVTPTPLPLINPAFAEGHRLFGIHRFNAWLARRARHIFGYQFILFGEYQGA